MSYDDDALDDDWYDELERHERELVEAGIREQRDHQIRDYLSVNGDAVQARIDACLDEAERLLEHGFPSASMVRAVTAIELAIRYFVLRPVIGGAFLSEDWAALLLTKVLRRNSGSDRDLLPSVLAVWQIHLRSINLRSGAPLWETFVPGLVEKRNSVVHKGDVATDVQAQQAIEVAREFLELVIAPLSDRFGLSWSQTRVWSVRQQGVGGAEFSGEATRDSPFKETILAARSARRPSKRLA